MDEQRLWAPWRSEYVSAGSAARAETEQLPTPLQWRDSADENCFLCRAAADYLDTALANQRLLVVLRQAHVVALLNRYPYTNGHLLVAPLRHIGQYDALTADEHEQIVSALGHLMNRLTDAIRAEGFNVGLNLGRVAGAGVPGHLHWHIVPRWSGDSNFMSTLADTRVISQSLATLWELLTRGDA